VYVYVYTFIPIAGAIPPVKHRPLIGPLPDLPRTPATGARIPRSKKTLFFWTVGRQKEKEKEAA